MECCNKRRGGDIMCNEKIDRILGVFFALGTGGFLWFFITSNAFFDWTFARHHNVLSWYIRPLFIIPIGLFAYKQSWTGIFASIFALFTSMFWFPIPEVSNPQVIEFLAFEKEWILSAWDPGKVFMTFSVPLFFALIIMAAWQRKWKWFIVVIAVAAVLKVAWSVTFSGEAGLSILKPAAIGLVVCIVGVFYFYRRKKLT